MHGKEPIWSVLSNNFPADIFSDWQAIIKLLLCFAIASLLYGVTILRQGSQNPGAAERNKTMFVAQENSLINQTIPQIDLSAPAKVETATFALG